MKAAVLRAPGKLVIDDIPEPACPPGGALIRVEACAVCPTDIKMARVGQKDLTYPRILGHEVVGTIIATDSEGTRPGDLVQVWPGIVCGTCPSCQRGQDNLCDRQGIIGFNADGGLAEVMAIPAGTLRAGGVNVLPKGADPSVMTLAEPLGCCVHGQQVIRLAHGDRAIVFGAGTMGLMHTALAVSAGASVMVVEPMPERRQLAIRLGAEVAVGPESEDVEGAIMDWTGGRGADAAILATPQVRLGDALARCMAPGGRVCLFSGLPSQDPEVRLDANTVHYRELTVAGAYGCTSASNRKAVQMLASGKVDLSFLITGRMALGEIERAFRLVEERAAMKVVITELTR